MHAFEIAMNLKECVLEKPFTQDYYSSLKPKVDAGLLSAVNQVQSLEEPCLRWQKKKRRLGSDLMSIVNQNSDTEEREEEQYYENRERKVFLSPHKEESLFSEESHCMIVQNPACTESHYERFAKHARLLESLSNTPEPNENEKL